MFIDQVKRNSVAIISLVVALSSLAYNTWRNESSEANKTIRDAGFFMMQELSELQEIVLYARYDRTDERADIKSAWSHVLTVKDMSYTMPSSVQDNAQQLLKVWQENVAEIQAEEDHAYLQVDHAIDEVKKHIVSVIIELK